MSKRLPAACSSIKLCAFIIYALPLTVIEKIIDETGFKNIFFNCCFLQHVEKNFILASDIFYYLMHWYLPFLVNVLSYLIHLQLGTSGCEYCCFHGPDFVNGVFHPGIYIYESNSVFIDLFFSWSSSTRHLTSSSSH